jgi:hypothetical protein
MSVRPLILSVCVLACLCLFACNKARRDTEAVVVVEQDVEWRDMQRALTYMADNAMARELSIADLHFVPHTDEISGTGAVRLTRMARWLDTYGGTVRYASYEDSESLVARRLAHVQEFLAECGCAMNRVQLEAALPGGRSMTAEEALKIMQKASSTPAAAATGAAAGGAAAGGSFVSGGASSNK